jgi:hypothetical protein
VVIVNRRELQVQSRPESGTERRSRNPASTWPTPGVRPVTPARPASNRATANAQRRQAADKVACSNEFVNGSVNEDESKYAEIDDSR